MTQYDDISPRPSSLSRSSNIIYQTRSLMAMSPPSANVETPSSVVKRGRGRPRGSGEVNCLRRPHDRKLQRHWETWRPQTFLWHSKNRNTSKQQRSSSYPKLGSEILHLVHKVVRAVRLEVGTKCCLPLLISQLKTLTGNVSHDYNILQDTERGNRIYHR
jgi:hypothetical protein